MLPPVTLADLRPFDLARLGHPAPIVLTPADPLSPGLRYRVPEGMGGQLRVRLRATVVVADGHRRGGTASIGAEQDGHVSASVEVLAAGRRKVRWLDGGVHERRGVSSRPRFRVTSEQLSRAQGLSPGVHTLRFSLRTDGVRVRRVVIDPSSGFKRYRQPAAPLRVSGVSVTPATVAVGQELVVRVTLTNAGVLPTGPITFEPAFPDSGPRPVTAYPTLPSLAPGASTTTELHLLADRAGPPHFQLFANSRVGSELIDVGFVQDDTPPPG